jgi:limonene-1,2-epoxide hydrolase
VINSSGEFPTVSDSAESVVSKFLAAWKRSDPDELVSFFSDDAVWTDPWGVFRGIDAVRAVLQSAVKIVPSVTVDVKTLVANGGTVMTERVDSFKVQGEPFDLEVAGVFEVDSNGRINRWHEYYDRKSIEDRLASALAPQADLSN